MRAYSQFVRFALGERDREGLDRLVDQPAHHGGDGRRIDAAREKHAERHVGHQAQTHGLAEQLRPLGDVIRSLRARRRRLDSSALSRRIRAETHVPVLFDRDLVRRATAACGRAAGAGRRETASLRRTARDWRDSRAARRGSVPARRRRPRASALISDAK